MHASIHKQQLSTGQKQAQIQLTEGMILNTLLTGLEPKIAHVVRASDPADMLTAINRVRKELQLNYFETQKQNNNNRKTFHLNQNNEQEVYEQPNQNYYENTSDSYYTGNNAHTDTNYYPANNSEYYNNEDYYTANGPSENYYTEEPNYNTTLVYDQDFQLGPPPLSDPPDHNRDSNTAILQTQFGNMNLDNFNPNLNFPEQRYL
ncbi:hypothetical protein NQ318_010985 [Aromia moschata]|uniref:GATA zinc finger domain-containing protein 14-like n=1 Tax=Aromia moschata TaxID=1265417 RepID=A0AAV8YKL8_9CUCU|nr:hypothetical protein NQ318_010985 [Aromia moschata]